MKKYLLLLHDNVEMLGKLDPYEMKTFVKEHLAWAAKLKEKGNAISGDGLEDEGRRIVGEGCTVQKGPYVKSNELIGGYYLLQANNLEEITEIAKECPCHLWGGTTEIRTIMSYD